jgi:hypothetical protein
MFSIGMFLISAAVLTQDVRFEKDVLPVFAKRCQACHGPQQQMAGLRLDRADASQSKAAPHFIERVTSEKKGFRMPPIGEPLAAREVASIRTWVESGAKWPAGTSTDGAAVTHWAFQPPRKKGSGIDEWILARLKTEGIEPSPRADRATLIRRLSLDLTGLPPTPAEARAFIEDQSPEAYARAVDRLIASPHFGERWARYWLDLAHYADSDGYEKDLPRPDAWRYRHWVIDALNRDMPFDRFTVEQLAGDLLPGSTVDQKVATGFLRCVLTNREGGVDRAEARFEQLVNRTATVGTVWLGLTVGCAQCHNHKYDPISHKDYYGIMAFFEKGEDAEIDAPIGGEPGPYYAALPDYRQKRDAIYAKYRIPERAAAFEAGLKEAYRSPGKDLEWDFALTAYKAMVDRYEKYLTEPTHSIRDQETFYRYFVNGSASPDFRKDKKQADEVKEAKGQLSELDKTLPPFGQAMVVEEDPSHGETRLRLKGDYKTFGETVAPAGLSVLPPMPDNVPRDRLALAKWLVSRENPLTARVAMNRLWQEMFGRGIVKTSEDFGLVGDRPTHPELLDWLAVEFMDQGWSWKKMVRTVALSEAYQRSSRARKDLETKDPENTLFSHQNRLRLTAESIRDAALSASGLLDESIGGRSIRPPQPKGVAELGYGSPKWNETKGAERYRRGLYIHYQRTTPYPLLASFDAPDAATSCSRRRTSNTALQALNLLNDPVFFEASQALAARILREAPAGLAKRIEHAYAICFGRAPTARESERITQLYTRYSQQLDDATSAEWMPAPPDGVAQRDAAAWAGVARVLLNVDEFITRE